MKRFCAVMLILAATQGWATEPQRDQFVFTVLSTRGGSWDPDSTIIDGIRQYLTATTSVRVLPGRRAVAAEDSALFDSPFLCLTGHEPFESFSDLEVQALRRFLIGGGLIFANDAMASRGSGFDRAFRREMARVLPESEWQPLPKDHAVFRAFYLLRQVGGRVIASPTLEGLSWKGRTVVVYTQNDLLGVWARDRLGNYQQSCVPGGEPQRMEGMKLTLNVILYALTGTYKTDVIHLPFIQQKLNP